LISRAIPDTLESCCSPNIRCRSSRNMRLAKNASKEILMTNRTTLSKVTLDLSERHGN